MNFKPRLLRETAEIALSEIKRFIEPRLIDEFSLRRVSAPLFLPVESPLIDRRSPGVRITVTGIKGEVEIVGSLDVWLRGQLARYDIAPGFGVYTVMNGIRPELPSNIVSSPHITTWAWQQAVSPDSANRKELVSCGQRLYALLVEAEKMILDKFPHLSATLQKNLETVDEADLEGMLPEYTCERRIYQYLHPEVSDKSDRRSVNGKHCAAMLMTRGGDGLLVEGEIWVWNRLLNRPLRIAELAVWDADGVAGCSVGGNVFRDLLALQILHQDRILA